jgi:hypothetical protein
MAEPQYGQVRGNSELKGAGTLEEWDIIPRGRDALPGQRPFPFGFTKGAYEETARAKSVGKVEIQLMTVAELLERVPDLGAADTGQLVPDMPLPQPRPSDDRPSVDELVESEQEAEEGR